MPLHVPLYYPLPPHHPVTSSFPTPIGNPSPEGAVHPVADGPSACGGSAETEAESKGQADAHIHPPVIPTLFTLSSRSSARDLGLAPSHRSLPAHDVRPIHPLLRPTLPAHPELAESPPLEDPRVERMRSLAHPCHPQPQHPLLCYPEAPYFVSPTLFTLSSRGSARDLGLAPSRQSLPPRPTPNPFADSPKR